MNKREAILKGVSIIEKALEEKDAVYLWAVLAISTTRKELFDGCGYWQDIRQECTYKVSHSREEMQKWFSFQAAKYRAQKDMPGFQDYYLALVEPYPLPFTKTQAQNLEELSNSNAEEVCIQKPLTKQQERELAKCRHAIRNASEEPLEAELEEKKVLVEQWVLRQIDEFNSSHVKA